METEVKEIHEDLLKMRRDIELIKHILMSEGELTVYAKRQLIKSRKEKEESYVSLHEL